MTNYEWKNVTSNYAANQKYIKVTWYIGIFHRESMVLIFLQVDSSF